MKPLSFTRLWQRDRSGSVLLEVVLALALFVGAATIITSGINASMRAVERVRLQNHAINLAITVFSEMHIHARAVAAAGPEPFPAPFQNWTYKIEIAQSETAMDSPEALRQVEVVIKNTMENVTHRLAELFPASAIGDADTNSPSALFASPP
jgi:hypothetical protein